MGNNAIVLDVDARLDKFGRPDTAIAKMAEEYMPLVINGVADIKGFKAVHDARMIVRNKRVEVEKVRKALKADALEYGRKVDGEAKRITALLEPIESHLDEQETAYNAEKERIRNAELLRLQEEKRKAEEAEAARIRAEQEAEAARIKAEQDTENERLRIEREKLADERRVQEAELAELRELIAEQRAKAEAERAAKEKAERAAQEAIDAQHREYEAKLEAERLAEQEKIDAQRREIEAQQAEIRAEQKRLADIEAARIRAEEEAEAEKARQIELEKAKAEAAERSRKETEERIAREAAEAKAKAEREEAARLRAEALRPDREKLLGVAAAVRAIVVPEVSSDQAMKASKAVKGFLANAAAAIEKTASMIA